MNLLQILLSIAVILFASLGLFDIIPMNIANPSALFFLASLMLLRSFEDRKKTGKTAFLFALFTALFLYVIVFYTTFIK